VIAISTTQVVPSATPKIVLPQTGTGPEETEKGVNKVALVFAAVLAVVLGVLIAFTFVKVRPD
jgi:hypothetical protein